ncbi:Exodeoxyribonuclease I [Buchnera aphidicola (Cinara piceae)]|uniref:Exodeoxyribonuclease I n=1 Tax=Buchnera aphidicola (Cinara piceae) TaxID=1660043 RepID=A0A803GDC8_9GAMM|nr:exodeoxyribonuclease I [Buchnera aphidicola]VFP88784.1 Exodeoxyribonuclease I [Buchnera aphidicola (Cinara piceae)]
MLKKQNNCVSCINNSFIFYDYETFGTNVSLDKVAQFCSIETDSTFSTFYKKTVLFCYPPLDYLPDPKSILITKILPEYTKINGLNEYYFSKKIYNIFSQKNVCIVGYNNINFDNLFTRNLFYRNLFDPYEWSWKNNNFSWDILNILRAFYIFDPEIMLWFYNVDGTVSFKLSDVTFINKISHTNAHDAFSDVIATILVAKYLYNRNKKFFLFLYKISHKKNILSFIYQNYKKPFFYLSSYFGSKNNNFGCVMIIGFHPLYNSHIIIIDLSINLKSLLNLYRNDKDKKLKIEKLFNNGIKIININRSPLLFSYNSISYKDCKRLKINYLHCQRNFFLLKDNIQIKNWIISFFSHSNNIKVNQDIDLLLYKNFFTHQDKLLFSFIHCNPLSSWISWNPDFIDCRIKKIFFRLKARNFINLLNKSERKKWKLYCQKKINFTVVDSYIKNIRLLQLKYDINHSNYLLLDKLIDYVHKIIYKINNLIK